MPIYFAYGSNMDEASLRRRCPSARRRGLARLLGHRFILMADGYASVEPAEGQVVHGVLFDLDATDIAPLDAYEDVAGGLYIKTFRETVPEGGAPVEAMIYIGTGKPGGGGAPPSYMTDVAAQARQAGLPRDYIAMLDETGQNDATARGLNV